MLKQKSTCQQDNIEWEYLFSMESMENTKQLTQFILHMYPTVFLSLVCSL